MDQRYHDGIVKEQSLLPRALATAILLPPALLATYVFCGWLTRGPSLLSTFHFGWERHIPLVPWMIIPYLSLDALLVTGIFLCRDAAELRRLTLNLGLATLIAAACFIGYPRRFGFERVAPPGPMGRACEMLWKADRSYNRLPSLHVAIALILWIVFARHSRGVVAALVHAW